MFNSIGWGELLLLLAVGLIVLGPERLPTYVADAVKLIGRLRELSTSLTNDLRDQLGPDLTSLTTATPAATPAADGYWHVPRHPMFDEIPAPTPPSESSSPPASPASDDHYPQHSDT